MVPDKTSNARNLDRIPTHAPVTLVYDSQGQQLRQRAILLDVSDRGMRLKTSAELAKGQVVDVISQHGLEEPERTRVAWVSEAGDEHAYIIGLETVEAHLMSPDNVAGAVSELIELGGKKQQAADETRQAVGDDRGPMAKS
jgi:PilZ domain